MSYYKKLAEYAAENITGVAGSFSLTQDNGNFYVREVHSTVDCQKVDIEHHGEVNETIWEVTYKVKSRKLIEYKE